MTDARKATTLDEAARNPDGTYNGARALSWLSDVLTGGKGMPEGEIKQIFEDARAQRKAMASEADQVERGVTSGEASINAGARRTAHRFSL